jgi:hypothetical protein
LLTAATVQAQRTALDIFLSYANLAAFPASGNFQRLYLALDTAKTYVWNGSGYTEVSPSQVTSVNTITGAVTLTASDVGACANNDSRIANIRSNSINTQNTVTSSMGVGLGGSINLDGFIDAEPYPDPTNGGSIDLRGGIDGNGGSIITSAGGGSINTYEGYIQLGVSNAGMMTTITGSASSNRTIILPDKNGTVALTLPRSGANNIAANDTALSNTSLSSSNNTAVGANALNLNNAGASNSAFGAQALQLNQSGSNNCAFGEESLRDVTGNNNCAFGVNTLRANRVSDNTAFGHGALLLNNFGIQNAAFGRSAAENITSGSFNTAIGAYALYNVTSGIFNVGIGRLANASSSAISNEVTISNGTVVARFQGAASAWAFTSDERDKSDIENLELGLDFINQLQPRKFKWSIRNSNVDQGKEAAGFIAQEVLSVTQANQAEYLGLVDTNDPNHFTLGQTSLIPVLVNAIKELKAEIEILKAK